MKAMEGIWPNEACKKHKGEPLFGVAVYDIEDKDSFVYQSDYTMMVYLTLEGAKNVAKNIAYNIAYHKQMRNLDDPEYPTEDSACIACVVAGRRVSKKGTIYGSRKIIYAISTQTKEVTERFVMDKQFKDLQIDEYTEQPKLTKDMFHQWED